MQNIQSYSNPFSNLDSPVDNECERRNRLCKNVALAILGIGLIVTVGAGVAAVTATTFSALPVAIAGIAAVTAYVAKIIFNFLDNINNNLKNFLWGGPLHKSAMKGQVMMTKLYLFLGANPNKKSGYGDTPLHMACFGAEQPQSKAHIKVIELLLNSGATINASGNYNRCPLHYALDARHIDRVEFLVNNGAFINLKHSFDRPLSPWEYAKSFKDETKIYKRLGSDPRKDSELLEAGYRIYNILNEKGKVYSP